MFLAETYASVPLSQEGPMGAPGEQTMPQRTTRVTVAREGKARLPDDLVPGAVMLEWLNKNGKVEQFAERFRVVRQGGYCARDVIVFLVPYFASGCGSLRGFAEFIRPWRARLAAPVGLRTMPHQSSVSRFCRAVGADTLRAGDGSWLLLDACAGADLLGHASTGHRDACGQRWDVFDFDPAVLCIRQRGLPQYQDAPDGRRRSEQAVPGYGGRHRGEVTVSRMLLRHSGSGLWLNCEVHPGNGDLRGAFQRCVQTVASVCDRTGIERERAIVRCDGGFGHVPYVAFCEQHNLAFLTRLSHYGLFERDEIKKHLAQALWCRVEDSKSGPLREAADLGEVTLLPAARTRKADGAPFDPVKVRVVASRAHTDNDNGAGVLIDGKLHELYGTTLRPDGWPPEDVVSLYSARADIENGINQAQQLCGLDRILSHHIPGQELLTTVGLFVYNLQTVLGAKIEGLPEDIAAQTERTQWQREPVCDTKAEEHAVSHDANNATANSPSDANGPLRRDAIEQAHTDDVPAAGQAATPPTMKPNRPCAAGEVRRRTPATSEGLAVAPHQATNADAHGGDRDGRKATPQHGAVALAEAQLGQVLDELDWKRLIDRLGDGWTRSRGSPLLVCPEGHPLMPLQSERDRSRPRRRRLILAASRVACGRCPHREPCAAPRAVRLVRTGIPVDQADRIDSALRQLRQAKRENLALPREATPQEKTPKKAHNPSPGRLPGKGFTFPWQPPLKSSARPPLMPQPPLFLAAESRKAAREELARIQLEVTVTMPLPKAGPRLVATSTSQRQCRRRNWIQRHQFNALPEEAQVEVRATVAKGGSWVAALYQPTPATRAA